MSANLQDAMFYTNAPDYEIVYAGERFYACRNGEMTIINRVTGDVYRYTSDLISAGLDTDSKLEAINNEELFTVVNNPWFEIVDSEAAGQEYDIVDNYDQAVEAVNDLERKI